MRAIIVGATGATGKDLLEQILKDEAFTQVMVFVRRNIEIEHPKLVTHIIDFDEVEEWKHLVLGDVLFSCLGTTLKAAGSKEKQWRIDYDYQYQFAKVAKENGVKHYVLVSSAMANAQSQFYYIKMKGKLEEAVKALGFERLSIFNPPTLIRKNSDRTGENISVKVFQFLGKFGLFTSQQPLPTEQLAQAMLVVAKQPNNRLHFTRKEIEQLLML